MLKSDPARQVAGRRPGIGNASRRIRPSVRRSLIDDRGIWSWRLRMYMIAGSRLNRSNRRDSDTVRRDFFDRTGKEILRLEVHAIHVLCLLPRKVFASGIPAVDRRTALRDTYSAEQGTQQETFGHFG